MNDLKCVTIALQRRAIVYGCHSWRGLCVSRRVEAFRFHFRFHFLLTGSESKLAGLNPTRYIYASPPKTNINNPTTLQRGIPLRYNKIFVACHIF